MPVSGDRKPTAAPLPDLDDDVVEALADVKAKPSDAPEENKELYFSEQELAEAEAIRVSKQQPSAAEQAKAKLEKPVPTSEFEHINIGLPPYVMEQVRLKAIKDKSSVRFEILRGLRRVGYDIRDVDMIKDARRGKGTGRRRKS